MAELCPFEVKPFAKSEKTTNPANFQIDYVNQDFWSMKQRILEIIKTNHSQHFDDFNESSLALMLIEAWAFLADQLSFKIDQLANEMFIDTATELHNVTRLARLVGFKPVPPLPAKAMFNLSIAHPLSDDIPIQTPFTIAYSSPYGPGEIRMELFASDANGNPLFGQDIVFPAGHTSIAAAVGIEGSSHSYQWTGSGKAWQMYTIPGGSVLWNSVKVSVDGILWQEVEFFSDSVAKKEYKVEYSPDFKATVVFGDNFGGLIPAKGSSIQVIYRIGGGTIGNIVSGAIDQNVSLPIPSLGYTTVMKVRNYTKAEGGYNGDTIDDIRRKLPLYLRTQDRAVTGEDYKALVDNFATPYNGIIGKSLATLRNHGCAGNIIDIYILSRDGNINLAKSTDGLKADLAKLLTDRKMFTDTICIKDGSVVLADVNIEIIMDKINQRMESPVKEKVLRRVYQLFSLNNWEFGQSLKDSNLIKQLSDIIEISHVDVTFTTENSIEKGQGHTNSISPKFYEIIRPDNININISYKGSNE